MTHERYSQAKKVDDLAFRVVSKSLPTDLSSVISNRILYDYISDVGAIGILRKLYLEKFDLDDVCKLYWSSRREIGNPNFESILSQLLINISASFIYDQIKALYESGLIAEQWLSLRGIAATAGFFTPSEFTKILEDARLLHSLYRLKQDPNRAETASNFVRKVLSDRSPLEVMPKDSAQEEEFELIVENMRVLARGILSDSIRDTGHKVQIPAGGLVLQGSPASSGMAWGKPIIATEFSLRSSGDMIVALDSNELDPEHTVSAVHLCTAAITADSMTGHVPVLARGIGRPCVANIPWKNQNLANFSFAIVDGYAGTVRLFMDRPVGYPDLSGKRSFYRREGD